MAEAQNMFQYFSNSLITPAKTPESWGGSLRINGNFLSFLWHSASHVLVLPNQKARTSEHDQHDHPSFTFALLRVWITPVK